MSAKETKKLDWMEVGQQKAVALSVKAEAKTWMANTIGKQDQVETKKMPSTHFMGPTLPPEATPTLLAPMPVPERPPPPPKQPEPSVDPYIAKLTAEVSKGVGRLPDNHYNAWIKIPAKKAHQHAYARHEDGSFSSRPTYRDLSHARLRYDRHHEDRKGWRSKWHPKTLDYRTVDELGLEVKTLNELRLSQSQPAKQHAETYVEQMIVKGKSSSSQATATQQQPSQAKPSGKPLSTPSLTPNLPSLPPHAGTKQIYGGDGSFGSAFLLEPEKPVYGEVKPKVKDGRVNKTTQYVFYKIDVPDEEIPGVRPNSSRQSSQAKAAKPQRQHSRNTLPHSTSPSLFQLV